MLSGRLLSGRLLRYLVVGDRVVGCLLIELSGCLLLGKRIEGWRACLLLYRLRPIGRERIVRARRHRLQCVSLLGLTGGPGIMTTSLRRRDLRLLLLLELIAEAILLLLAIRIAEVVESGLLWLDSVLLLQILRLLLLLLWLLLLKLIKACLLRLKSGLLILEAGGLVVGIIEVTCVLTLLRLLAYGIAKEVHLGLLLVALVVSRELGLLLLGLGRGIVEEGVCIALFQLSPPQVFLLFA